MPVTEQLKDTLIRVASFCPFRCQMMRVEYSVPDTQQEVQKCRKKDLMAIAGCPERPCAPGQVSHSLRQKLHTAV